MAANFCPLCRRATGVLLWEIHKQNHVYHVGVGQAEYVGRFCRCMDCSSEWTVPEGTIRRTLDPSVPVTLDEMVAETYPHFHAAFGERLQLEEVIARGEAASLGTEARLKLIAEPFFLLDNDIRKDEDANSGSGGCFLPGLGCFGTLVLALITLVAFAAEGGILAGCALLVLTAGLGWVTMRLLAARHVRYMRKRIYPRLASCLAPLYPTVEELTAVKGHIHSRCASQTRLSDLRPLMEEVRDSALERLRQAGVPAIPPERPVEDTAGHVMPGAQAAANPWAK